MKKLDLHGKTHEESEFLVIVFIENNIDYLPIQIITGNSVHMQNILTAVIGNHNLRIVPSHSKNLGSYIITKQL